MHARPLLVALVLTGASAGCLGVGDEADGGKVAALRAEGNTFVPPRLEVAPGATVAVVNRDGVPHTATSVSGAFDTGEVAGGATGTLVAPLGRGEYPFVCAYHATMKGTLVVR